MAEDLQAIRRFVRSLALRERWVLTARSLARCGVIGAVLFLLGVLAARGHWDRPASVMVIVGGGAVAAWWWVVAPLLRWWTVRHDVLRQARRVERINPELRGLFVTAVAHTQQGDADPAPLMALVARRARAGVARVTASRVHPASHLVRTALVAALSWCIVLPSVFGVPGGPRGLVSYWLGGSEIGAALAAGAVEVQEAEARVGDLILRYTYPEYTGLDPREVANTTGDVTGVPGTVVEVVARAASPVEAAGLLVGERTFDAALAADQRQVTGRFPIAAEPSTWRLLLYRGGEPERSRAFAITPQPDLPPEVLLDSEVPTLEVAVDQPFPLSWQVKDDYGVREAVLSWPGGERVLFEADGRRADVFGGDMWTPLDLGLVPGDDVELVVRAWDNDTVSGSKEGTSAPVRLVVLGARGLERQRLQRQQELEKLMVPLLARMLTQPWPPAEDERGMVRWGETVGRRFEPLQQMFETEWVGLSREGLDWMFVQRVLMSGRELARYTQVAFDPRSDGRPALAEMQRVEEMHENAISAVERALLAFLRERQYRALGEVVRKAQELREVSQMLAEALQQEQPDTLEVMARLEQAERLFNQLMSMVANLEDGGLKSFLNTREHELTGLMNEIRTALADGRVEDAERLMERLTMQIDELVAGVEFELAQRQAQAEEGESQARALLEELEALEQAQRGLQEELQQMREQSDSQGSERAGELWQEVERLAGEALSAGSDYRQGLRDADRPFFERERSAGAVEALESLQGAVQARDLRGVAVETGQAMREWVSVQRTAEGLHGQRPVDGPPPADAVRVLRLLQQIAALMEQLDQQAAQMSSLDPQRARDLQDRQRDLENRLEQARSQAEEVASQMPISPEGLPEMLGEAQQRMEDASGDLGEGRGLSAEGSQSVAAERIRRARSSLEQAIRASQQISQGGGGGGEGEEQGQGSGQGGSGNGRDMSSDLFIPGREAYQTPEAYRKALLEGMEGEVPEAYRAWKKRYYEELVQQ